MIIINLKHFEDFCNLFVTNRTSNYLFYEIRQADSGSLTKSTVYFNFLGSHVNLNVMYQYCFELSSKNSLNDFFSTFRDKTSLDTIFFTEGTIREIILSLS
jgi:hypothetical protein